MNGALDHAEAALVKALAAVRAAQGKPSELPSDLLDVDEAARLAGRTPSTIRRWAAQHRLGRRLGGTWVLSRSKFTVFVDGDRV